MFLDRLADKRFSSFISQDGWFKDSAKINELEQQVFDASGGSLPVTLVMSGADCCNWNDASRLYHRIEARSYRDLISRLTRYSESHDNMFYPSFVEAVRILFAR